MRKLLVTLLAALASASCLAQPYPAKPVRLIVPFPPGGTADLIARIVQPKFQEFLGQQVVVDYRGGAGGSIGTAEAARSAPDGYTLLLVFDTHAVNHHLYRQAVDPLRTLDHIMLMVTSPSMLVAVSGFPPTTVAQLVARAKADAGGVTYATAGAGSSNHMGALLLEQHAGIRMTHVPYKGGGPMIQALLGNQVDIAIMSTPLILPHVQSGRVKALATGGKQRLAQLPELPTLGETFPGFEQVSWFGLVAPIGLPKDVSMKIHREMANALQSPGTRRLLTERGFDVVASSPAEFLRFVQLESDKLGRLARDSKIQVD